MSQTLPPRVPRERMEDYHIERPPEMSERCIYWVRQIREGWRPNRRIKHLDVFSQVEFFGVYVWEFRNVIYPLIMEVLKQETTTLTQSVTVTPIEDIPLFDKLAIAHNAHQFATGSNDYERWVIAGDAYEDAGKLPEATYCRTTAAQCFGRMRMTGYCFPTIDIVQMGKADYIWNQIVSEPDTHHLAPTLPRGPSTHLEWWPYVASTKRQTSQQTAALWKAMFQTRLEGYVEQGYLDQAAVWTGRVENVVGPLSITPDDVAVRGPDRSNDYPLPSGTGFVRVVSPALQTPCCEQHRDIPPVFFCNGCGHNHHGMC